jgi:hypothetical protein
MTTPPYGETDPLSSTTTPLGGPQHAGTPIGDDLAGSTGLGDSTGFSDSTGSSDDSSSTASSAKETAQEALSSASEHGSQVAGTAKSEAADVVAEAKDKATDLLADVKTQADEQSKTQLKNLAAKIGELADELDGLVRGSDTGGTVTDAAQQLADKTRQLSSHLDSRQPLDLLEDMRSFARRRPAAFLGGAAVAGVLAGRLTRGAKAAQDSSPTSTSPTSTSPTSTGYAAPATSTAPTSTASTSTFSTPVPHGVDDVPANQNMGGRQ